MQKILNEEHEDFDTIMHEMCMYWIQVLIKLKKIMKK